MQALLARLVLHIAAQLAVDDAIRALGVAVPQHGFVLKHFTAQVARVPDATQEVQRCEA